VGVGTDGPASNNDLDMFEEVRLAALLAKDGQAIPRCCRPARRWSWPRGAARKALHMGELTGSLEPGKRADHGGGGDGWHPQLAPVPQQPGWLSTPA
jgi:5-methylthioadenosine/S-adenosylhomocysteine deaminase